MRAWDEGGGYIAFEPDGSHTLTVYAFAWISTCSGTTRRTQRPHLVRAAGRDDVDRLRPVLGVRVPDLLAAPGDAGHELLVRLDRLDAAAGLEFPDPNLVVVCGGEHVLAARVEHEPADPVIVPDLPARRC
jgi:hypothetical protein